MAGGANLGAYGSPGGLLFVDVDLTGGRLVIPADTVESMIRKIDTFTVRTRSGGYHLYFQNVGTIGDGAVRNPHIYWNGEDAGECRADWQYVLLPGSYVDPDHNPTGTGKKGKTADATGYYTIRLDAPIRPFDPSKLPQGLTLGRTEPKPIRQEGPGDTRSFANIDGLELAIVRQRASEVHQALAGAVEADRSGADQGLVNRLIWWNFDDAAIGDILRHFRPYEKTARDDYIASTIATGRAAAGSDRYSPEKLLPKAKAEEIAKATPPTLAKEINRGALAYVGAVETVENLRELALYLLNDGRGTPDVVKAVARANAKLPEGDRLAADDLIGLAEKAGGDIGAARRRAFATAVVLRREEAAPSATAEEVAAGEAARKIEEEAREILTAGDPFGYMLRAYNLDHIGDTVLGQCLVVSLASRLVFDSKGINVLATGESGKGKSDGYRTMLKQVPDRFNIGGSFSDKSLYYFGAEGLLEAGSVFIVDDKDMSDQLQAILKEATSTFGAPIQHRTTTTDRKPIVCTIPERCVWWLAKVGGVGDDQVLNRMLVCWVDDSVEQDKRVVAAVLAAKALDTDVATTERREVAVCRAMWEMLHADGVLDVNLSRFAVRIRFGSYNNRRNPQMFLDMITAAARVNAAQRERRNLPDGRVRIYANEEDFATAEKIFTALHGASGGQESKLTRREAAVLDLIVKSGLERFDVATLQARAKLSYNAVYQALNGTTSHGTTYAGLVEKCPAISPVDFSVAITRREYDPEAPQDSYEAKQSVTTGRRSATWTFDKGLYTSWKTGAIVWLDPVDPKGGPFAEVATTSGNLADHAANETGRESLADLEYRDNIEKVSKRETVIPEETDHTHASQREGMCCDDLTENVDHDHGLAKPSACDGDIFRKQIANSENLSPIAKRSDLETPSVCETLRNTSQDDTSAARMAIAPADFVLHPDKVSPGPCQRCGAKLVHYKERYQALQARGKKATAYLICRGCYEDATRREVAEIHPLPGTLPLDEIERVETPDRITRCSICHLDRIAYRHPGSNSAICASCYAKITREQVDVR